MSKYSNTVYLCAARILCILKAAVLNVIISVLSGCLAMPGCCVLAMPHRARLLPSNCQEGERESLGQAK